MDSQDLNKAPQPCVKASLSLGSEQYVFTGFEHDGLLSDRLVKLKEQCMSTFKDYLIRHNAPTDVPDEVQESSSEEEDSKPSQLPKRSKKLK